MFKTAEGISAGWVINDSARSPFNVGTANLFANGNNAETSTLPIDFLSNGFKIRNAVSGYNSNNIKYIYMAFAEQPFKNANAR